MAIGNWYGRVARICGFAVLALAVNLGGSYAKAVVIKRTTVYVATLPKGCVKTNYNNGVVVWKCGTQYYMPYGSRYVRVYIN